MKSIRIIFLLVIFLSACKAKYPNLENGLYADIQTNKGDVLVKLHYTKVPMTVANFVALTEGTHPKLTDSLKGKPFYDGVKFHRVIKDFMVQSGDPTGKGSGDAGYMFDDEFPLNEQGKLLYPHNKAGVLSMANAGPATNSSQFFITHKETPWLDGKHSVFGQVYEGQSVIDTIKQNDFINKIEIIRVGNKAKVFDAPSVFSSELKKKETEKAELKKKLAEDSKRFKQEMGFDKSVKTESGLQVLQLKEGKGKKVSAFLPTTVCYTLYSSDGKTLNKNKEITFILNKDPLVAGWKEGVSMMREGEKSRLFVPSYLGYGLEGRLPIIKPNTDLIFEIEVLKVGE